MHIHTPECYSEDGGEQRGGLTGVKWTEQSANAGGSQLKVRAQPADWSRVIVQSHTHPCSSESYIEIITHFRELNCSFPTFMFWSVNLGKTHLFCGADGAVLKPRGQTLTLMPRQRAEYTIHPVTPRLMSECSTQCVRLINGSLLPAHQLCGDVTIETHAGLLYLLICALTISSVAHVTGHLKEMFTFELYDAIVLMKYLSYM